MPWLHYKKCSLSNALVSVYQFQFNLGERGETQVTLKEIKKKNFTKPFSDKCVGQTL